MVHYLRCGLFCTADKFELEEFRTRTTFLLQKLREFSERNGFLHRVGDFVISERPFDNADTIDLDLRVVPRGHAHTNELELPLKYGTVFVSEFDDDSLVECCVLEFCESIESNR